ncbi:GTP-binding protein [Pantoea sp. Seng]|uniref:GTPase family protein n=1 Tax=Pantoea sp. Seng TaxID=2576761 RepID=UPI00132ADA8F|nr:GTPase [Pantoea sp. Seng]MXP51792.1 GTP-binding protein [Pantoea sp. Seng]
MVLNVKVFKGASEFLEKSKSETNRSEGPAIENGKISKNKIKPSKILDEILSTLPPEISRYTKKKLTEVIDYEPRIGVMGKTGVGKSSLCNAIFQQDVCKVSHVEACTREIEELQIDVGGRKLTIVDLPGVGESKERDVEYKSLYEEQIPNLDLILWVIKADDRVLAPDEEFYKNVIKPLKAEDKILFVINQADKIEPSFEWNRLMNSPSTAQIQNLETREMYIYEKLFETSNGCVAVSAPLNYNIGNLVKKMVLRLPKKSKAGVYSTLREEYKSEEIKKESKDGFNETLKGVLDHVIDSAPIPAIFKEPLKKAKDYICNKISSFFSSWF